LKKIVDHRQPGTLAASFRSRRFQIFLKFIADLPRPLQILDIGGEQVFWERMGVAEDNAYQITLLNIVQQPVSLPNFRSFVGQATDLGDFADQSFDMAFSNSTIEHLGSFAAQRQMAKEVLRVGRRYFVQTPNRFFPLEPHFLIPFFQFFPGSFQVELVRRFNLGWYHKIPDKKQAQAHVRSHRLMTAAELRSLFPSGQLYYESAFGMTKSLVILGPV
jgi:hypothetical protein